MTKTSFLLFFILCAGLVSANSKIVGGKPIEIKNAPYQVCLEVLGETQYSFNCGGVIIGPNYFLTAGHCVNPDISSNSHRIRVGSEKLDGGEIYGVKTIIRHPNYTVISEMPAHADDDIAFVITEQPLNFSDTVKPIAFAQSEPLTNDDVQVTGWGRISPGGNVSQYLQQLNLTIVDRLTCKKELSDTEISQTTICAKPIEEGTDPCNGDSGGPLVGNGVLVGLVSFGGLCQDANYKIVAFTNIANYYDWILEQILAASQ